MSEQELFRYVLSGRHILVISPLLGVQPSAHLFQHQPPS